MHHQVDHRDRDNEPADQFHPQYESFTDWLNAAAPVDAGVKLRNQPRYRAKRANTVTVAQLARR